MTLYHHSKTWLDYIYYKWWSSLAYNVVTNVCLAIKIFLNMSYQFFTTVKLPFFLCRQSKHAFPVFLSEIQFILEKWKKSYAQSLTSKLHTWWNIGSPPALWTWHPAPESGAWAERAPVPWRRWRFHGCRWSQVGYCFWSSRKTGSKRCPLAAAALCETPWFNAFLHYRDRGSRNDMFDCNVMCWTHDQSNPSQVTTHMNQRFK